MLLALPSNRSLVSAKDFVSLRDWELLDRDVVTLWVLDNNGGSVSAMAEEGSAGCREVESHGLIGTFRYFKSATSGPEDIMPKLGIVGASEC